MRVSLALAPKDTMRQLSIAGKPLEYFHICAFFSSKDEEYDVLCPFYREGLDQGEKNLHIVDPAFALEHRERLACAGIDSHAHEACGRLDVLTWHQGYFNEAGAFDKDRMLATLDRLTGAGRDAGYTGVRIMGNMDWALADHPGAETLLEYEVAVNEVLSRNRQPAVCVYDIEKLTGAMMMDLLRTHPLTLIGGVVQDNPFYIHPAAALEELRNRANSVPEASEETTELPRAL
jgi:hypothetical protein